MCFIIYSQRKPQLKIAEKKIIVYKRLTRNNLSPYQDYLYERFSVYTSDIQQTNLSIFYPGRYQYDVALHAYTTVTRAHKEKSYWNYEKIVEMYIPAGAFYMTNSHQEIITNILITTDLKKIT